MFRLVLSIVTSNCPTIEHRRVDHLEDNYELRWHRNSKSKQCNDRCIMFIYVFVTGVEGNQQIY